MQILYILHNKQAFCVTFNFS